MGDVIQDTIVALSTPSGRGALAIIRLSGPDAISTADTFFAKDLAKAVGNTTHYGEIKNEEGDLIDECIIALYRAPKSYTGEDIIELSCHGSTYIIEQIISLFVRNGLRLATAGEFTQRAYLNGHMDLSQAEAVADLISSHSRSQHRVALHQMRGGISKEIRNIRSQLIEFASLIELENDFGEEDVEFADRRELTRLSQQVTQKIDEMISTFELGNAIKEGVSVAIIGAPNVGKSTLLNTLLKEDKAIISEIPGTTRDLIEDTIDIDGILFRFVDTAGLRDTSDKIELLGIERTKSQIKKARIIIFMTEINEDFQSIVDDFNKLVINEDQKSIVVLNKIDNFHTCHAHDIEEAVSTSTHRTPAIALSAKTNDQVDRLKSTLVSMMRSENTMDEVIVTNIRHYEALFQASQHLKKVIGGLVDQIPSDIIAIDIRHALYHLGLISGEVTTDDILGSIFSKFCIGK